MDELQLEVWVPAAKDSFEGAKTTTWMCDTAYPRMEAWFRWFQRTQAGQLPGTFRWRGRGTAPEWDTELNRKTFASGAESSCHPDQLPRKKAAQAAAVPAVYGSWFGTGDPLQLLMMTVCRTG